MTAFSYGALCAVSIATRLTIDFESTALNGLGFRTISYSLLATHDWHDMMAFDLGLGEGLRALA